MKKLGRSYQRLETLNLFSRFQNHNAAAIYDPTKKKSFLQEIEAGLDKGLQSESTLHGLRVQLLFQLMMANIGDVQLIKDEDSGDIFYSGDPIIVPDYRVITDGGAPLLIEVKNHFSKDGMRPFRIKTTYLEALQRYSRIVGSPLRIAVYWSQWNNWTLNDADRFTTSGSYKELHFQQAVIQNEMASLGDFTVGTVPPLQLRLKASRNHPRTITEDGKVSITIGGFEVLAGGQVLENEVEKSIAMYLMMFGKWEYKEGIVEFDEQTLPIAILHTVEPEEVHEEQGFDMVGSLSSLFSNFYNFSTIENGRVAHLWRVDDPGKLSPVIPIDYKGEQLKLWRFTLEPNFEQEETQVGA